MTHTLTTKEQLLYHATHQFWLRGYSNVSLREIAKLTQVDVSLIGRYYGSKLGLFQAALGGIAPFEAFGVTEEHQLVDAIVHLFQTEPRNPDQPSHMKLILSNSNDREVGELVQKVQREKWQEPLEELLQSKQRAALLMAAVFGFSLAEKTLHLGGIPHHETDTYERQLRHILTAALAFKD